MVMAKDTDQKKLLHWWQLSLLGVGCIIGTGFFLGSSIAIEMTGPSVIFTYLLAGLGAYLVYDSLGKMTADHPRKGSFRSYAKKAYGRWAGFSSGWIYWFSEMLIMGSQMTALSIFSRFWFPDIPLWIFASGYAVLGIFIILTGTEAFDKIESLFALMKIAAIVMFMLLAVAALLGLFEQAIDDVTIPTTVGEFFPQGLLGFWSSLIFGFYIFGGIEIVGILAFRLRDKQEAPKAGKWMLILLMVIYCVSIALALVIVPWQNFTAETSPFVVSLNNYGIPYVPHLFTAVLIIAGFSTMVAALFAVTSMVVTLAEERDAPPIFAYKVKKTIALPAIGLTTVGAGISIILSFLLPERIFEYFTTAAGLTLLYNWAFILLSVGRLIKLQFIDHMKRLGGACFILLAISGTLFHETSRPGFYVSILSVGIVALVTVIMLRRWKQEDPHPFWKRVK